MSDGAMVPLGHDQYMARKAIFAFLGQKFHIYDTNGTLCFFVQQKAFKLKEAITVYRDEGKTQPIMEIKARSGPIIAVCTTATRKSHKPASTKTPTPTTSARNPTT